MRIAEVRIEGYRCLQNVTVPIDEYTALVGTNGAGKSTVLYALDWFFNGGTLEAEDLCKSMAAEEDRAISVTVTFEKLTDRDRDCLRQYAVHEKAILRRSWSPSAGEKMIGNAVQGPGFASVRRAVRADEVKAAYAQVRVSVPDLPDVKVKASILSALDDWEADPANAERLEEVDDADANHLFGFNGENKLSSLIRMVLVPAASKLADEVGQANKGSALGALIGVLTSNAVQHARETWETDNAEQLAELARSIEQGVASATKGHADHVTQLLSELVPNASIRFNTELPTWAIRGEPSITTAIEIDGHANDVARQGHGVQRAVMIAMLQALVGTEMGQSSGRDAGDPSDTAAASAQPSLVVCIEEPEIYQHPVRSRSFARVLSQLAETERAQVVIATHSPYFVRPEQFSAIRRMALLRNCSVLTKTSLKDVADASGAPVATIEKLALKELPRNLSEGFFADGVVFVEGDTDKVIIEGLAERLSKHLDTAGVVIVPIGGKSSLRPAVAMLTALGVQCYIVADADRDGAERKHPSDSGRDAERTQVHQSNKAATDKLLSWLPSPTQAPLLGALPFQFGDNTLICAAFCIWGDDLESELQQWPSFMAALRSAGGSLRSKNAFLYRSALADADLADIPSSLPLLIEAVYALSSTQSAVSAFDGVTTAPATMQA